MEVHTHTPERFKFFKGIVYIGISKVTNCEDWVLKILTIAFSISYITVKKTNRPTSYRRNWEIFPKYINLLYYLRGGEEKGKEDNREKGIYSKYVQQKTGK